MEGNYHDIINSLGVLFYFSMYSVLTLSWFDCFSKIQIQVKEKRKENIVFLRKLWWVLNFCQYVFYGLYVIFDDDIPYQPLEILIFLITVLPAPIMLYYYAYKLIDIIEFLG